VTLFDFPIEGIDGFGAVSCKFGGWRLTAIKLRSG
jgi:hypothetical protein